MTDPSADRSPWAAPEAGVVIPRRLDDIAERFRVRDPVVPPVALRPLTVGAVLDGALALVKFRPALVLGVTALFVVPATALTYWLHGAPFNGDLASLLAFSSTSAGRDLEAVFDQSGWTWLTAAGVRSLATFLAGVALARLVGSWYSGRSPSWAEAIRSGLRRPVAVVGTWLVVASVQLVSACFVLFPLAWFLVAAPAQGVENAGSLAAVRRSASLTNRRFLPTVGVLTATIVVDQFLRVGLTVPAWWVTDQLASPVDTIVRVGVGLAVAVVSAAFVCLAAVTLYLDLRVRSEGLDLELEATDVFGLG